MLVVFDYARAEDCVVYAFAQAEFGLRCVCRSIILERGEGVALGSASSKVVAMAWLSRLLGAPDRVAILGAVALIPAFIDWVYELFGYLPEKARYSAELRLTAEYARFAVAQHQLAHGARYADVGQAPLFFD